MWAWWFALHAVLVSATALVLWPWAFKYLLLGITLGHAFFGRPRPSPGLVLDADGSCSVPEWGLYGSRLGPRTVIGSWWLRLDLERGQGRRDVVLLVDQLGRDEWRRLRAHLRRLHVD